MIYLIPNTNNSISYDTERAFILNLVLKFSNFTRKLSATKFLMPGSGKAPFPVYTLFSSKSEENILFFENYVPLFPGIKSIIRCFSVLINSLQFSCQARHGCNPQWKNLRPGNLVQNFFQETSYSFQMDFSDRRTAATAKMWN